MSILGSMYTGVSGLSASGQSMGIIGDNIANSGTTGFKASRGEFQDVVASNLKGILGGNQIGRGVQLSAVTPLFTQGVVTPTGRSSDMAISGDGFFILKNPLSNEINYTRDGSLRFDEKGRFTSSDGALVQGYKVDPVTGEKSADLQDVVFSSNSIPAEGTKKLEMVANLDSRKPINTAQFDPNAQDKQADHSTSVKVYDTTGTARSVNMYFYKTAENQWNWHATADGADLQGGVDGTDQAIASGVLKYTSDGKLDTDTINNSNINFRGAQPNQAIDFYFGDSITSRQGTGLAGSTQYGSDSQVFRQVQDGFAAGTLTNFSIDEKGQVSGSYSNGVTRPIAELALARFENNEGLYKTGGNRFKEAVNSGQPLVGSAGTAGRGRVMSKSLENSNVDLAAEFVKMIQTQRNFQANAKTITASDELLQDIINLKR
ncbi:flagellar hook protein FlgE [bacterium]|nr:flagellar hook protein FlgE [bacterium]